MTTRTPRTSRRVPALRTSRIVSFVVAGLLGTIATSCGGRGGASTIGSAQNWEVVEAPGPSAPQYETASTSGDAVRGPHAELVEAAVAAAASSHSVAVESDPRLAQLAEWILERLGPDGDVPPVEVVEFFARTLGLVEPVPHSLVLGQPSDMLREGLESSVGQFMDRQQYNRWGAAVANRGGLAVAVVVLSWRWVELEPVSRAATAGEPVRLRGRLTGDHHNPAVVVAGPDGALTRLPAGSGPDFDVRVRTEQPGAYQVELVGRGEHGDTVIANFPVYVGTEVPHVLRVSARDDRAAPDVSTLRGQLLELINETRRAQGLAEVRDSAALASVALEHSADMVANDFIGHTSPTTGSPADRVGRAHLPVGLVLENIGRGYDAAEIHRGLLESPGHRANLVNPRVTHVGIGVTAEPEGQRSAFVVTEVFIQMAERTDLAGAPAQLLSLVNRARSARGAPPLTAEDHLSEAAAHAAAQFFEDPGLSQQDTVDDASASLRRFSIAYRRLGGVMAIVADVDEAGALEPTLDPEVRHVGIGVAQGTRPDTGPNAIAVVFILAWPR